MLRSIWTAFSVPLAVAVFPAVASGAPLFLPLGDLPGGFAESVSSGISADGSTVVGSSSSSLGTEAFRWTQAGIVGLGTPGPGFESFALAASGNGATIVGFTQPAATSGREQAFRWSSAEGLVSLGSLGGANPRSTANGVSPNGLTIVGSTSSPVGSQAFRWTSETGMVGLGFVPGASRTEATAISANARTIVGTAIGAAGIQAFRWTHEAGMVGIGTMSSDFRSTAADVSGDGSTIVGQMWNPVDGNRGFIWTEATGFVDLGTADATAVSADGQIVVGDGFGDAYESFIWDPVNGARALDDYLTSLGLDVSGWQLAAFEGTIDISAGGTMISGWGINPDGNVEAYLAIIPEPTTAALLGLGLAWMARARCATRAVTA